MTSALSVSPCTRPGCALGEDSTPTFFPFSQLVSSSRPLSAVSRHPHLQSWIVISLSPILRGLSLFSCLGHKLPLSSDFSHPFPPHTRLTKRHQSHHPIPSQIFRSPPVPFPPHSPHIASHCLASLSAPVPCSPQLALFAMCTTHTACHHPSHGYAGQV
jgi:hypothetical protein